MATALPQQPQKPSQDIDTLRQIFPSVEVSVIESVYASLGNNFETTYKALDDIQRSDEEHIKIRLTPDAKLAFLTVVFDKLDLGLIRSTLEKYRMSVEGSLDDLLRAESSRAEAEEKERRRIEAERLRKEQEERQRLLQQQIEIERGNKLLQLQASFPQLDQQLVRQAIQGFDWNLQAAYQYLVPIEQQRQQREEQERLNRLEQARLEEERKREELQKEAEAMKAEHIEQVISGASSWDDIYSNFLMRVKASGGDNTVHEQKAIVEATKEVVPYLNDGEIVKVYDDKNWELDKSFPLLEQISMRNFKKRIEGVYPTLSPSDIDPVVNSTFPDESEAIDRLRPVATHRKTVAHLEKLVNLAQERLEGAMSRKEKFEKEKEEISKNRNKRINEMDKLEGPDRNMFQVAHEMKYQQEESMILENNKRYQEEVTQAQKEYNECYEKLKKEESQGPIWTSASPVQKSQNCVPKTSHELREAFNKQLAERKATIRKEREIDLEARKNIVVNKLYKELGQHRFGALQDAIGRAPGGVVRGYQGPSHLYVQPKDTSAPPSIDTSNSEIIAEKQVNVSEMVAKLQDTHINPNLTYPSQLHSLPPQTNYPTQQQQQIPPTQPYQQHMSPTSYHQVMPPPQTQSNPHLVSSPQQQMVPPLHLQVTPPHTQSNPQIVSSPPHHYSNPVLPQQQMVPPLHPQVTPPHTQFDLNPQNPQVAYPQATVPQGYPPSQQQVQSPWLPQYPLPTQQQPHVLTQPQLPTQQLPLPMEQTPPQIQTQPLHTQPQVLTQPQGLTQSYAVPITHPNFNLTKEESNIYEYYFSIATKGKNDFVTMQDADFFRRSNLDNDSLILIWSLASLGNNRLTREQFYIALRLTSMGQNKLPISLANIPTPLPIPYFTGINLTPVYPSQPQFTSPVNVYGQYTLPQQQGYGIK